MKLQKYLTTVSGLQIFQILRFGTLLLIDIIFTKTGVTLSNIGNYQTFLILTSAISSFWISGLIQSFMPLYKNNNTFKNNLSQDKKVDAKSPEIFNVFILFSIFSIFAIFILIAFNQSVCNFLEIEISSFYYKLVLCYVFFSTPSFLIEYIYLLRNKAGKIVVYGIVSFAVQFVLICGPAVLSMDMTFSLFGLVITALFRYVWLWYLLRKHSVFKISITFIKEHLKIGYPLILTALVGGSAQYIDAFLVLNKYDTAIFAIFKYGARELPPVMLLAVAFSNAMIPHFSNKEDISASLLVLKKKSTRLMHFLFPMTILFLLSSKWLYPIIFNQNVTDSAEVFNTYLLIIISRLLFPHTILIGQKLTTIFLKASILELILNVGLSIFLINIYGINGVAIATIIAYYIGCSILVSYNYFKLKIKPSSYIPLKIYVGYSVLCIFVYLMV